MNAEQKRAWLAVVSGIVCVVAFLVLMPFVGAWHATAAFALFAVNGLAPLIGRRDPADERDRSIALRATLGGAMCSYLGFYAACMGVWFVAWVLQGHDTISVHVFPSIAILGGLISLWFGRAVAILVLYGRQAEADNG